MPFKDHFFRRTAGSSTHSESSSRSTSTSNPILRPGIMRSSTAPTSPIPSHAPAGHGLEKTSSRLSKTLTWRGSNSHAHPHLHAHAHVPHIPSKEERQRKRIEEWEKRDEEEWDAPMTRRSGRKSQKHQDVLRAFEWKFGSRKQSMDSRSVVSGISPSQTRVNSVDDGSESSLDRVLSGRKSSAGVGAGPLSREVTRD